MYLTEDFIAINAVQNETQMTTIYKLKKKKKKKTKRLLFFCAHGF